VCCVPPLFQFLKCLCFVRIPENNNLKITFEIEGNEN